MRHAWLLDVLTDLRGFARDEGFDGLVEQFDDALVVAAREIARETEGAAHPPADLFAPGEADKRH